MRPEQPTVPDPDPRAAMAALLASTQAQEQAAAVLREAGWTVHAPGEVRWFKMQYCSTWLYRLRGGPVLGWIHEHETDDYPTIYTAHIPTSEDAHGGGRELGNYYKAEAEARSAVEAALKESPHD